MYVCMQCELQAAGMKGPLLYTGAMEMGDQSSSGQPCPNHVPSLQCCSPWDEVNERVGLARQWREPLPAPSVPNERTNHHVSLLPICKAR